MITVKTESEGNLVNENYLDPLTISVSPEGLKAVEGHPFILVDESYHNGCRYIVVLNVINRIYYVIFKNPIISTLLSSYHVEFDNSREAETLSSITSRLDCYISSKTFNESIDFASISKISCELHYIENGVIMSVNVDPSSTFNTLKKHTTDIEIIEVLESIINE